MQSKPKLAAEPMEVAKTKKIMTKVKKAMDSKKAASTATEESKDPEPKEASSSAVPASGAGASEPKLTSSGTAGTEATEPMPSDRDEWAKDQEEEIAELNEGPDPEASLKFVRTILCAPTDDEMRKRFHQATDLGNYLTTHVGHQDVEIFLPSQNVSLEGNQTMFFDLHMPEQYGNAAAKKKKSLPLPRAIVQLYKAGDELRKKKELWENLDMRWFASSIACPPADLKAVLVIKLGTVEEMQAQVDKMLPKGTSAPLAELMDKGVVTVGMPPTSLDDARMLSVMLAAQAILNADDVPVLFGGDMNGSKNVAKMAVFLANQMVKQTESKFNGIKARMSQEEKDDRAGALRDAKAKLERAEGLAACKAGTQADKVALAAAAGLV